MVKRTVFIALLACALACGKTEQSQTTKRSEAAAVSPTPSSSPAPVGPAASPQPAHAAGGASLAPTSEKLSGKVVEVLSSNGFTYLRLKTAKSEEWAAVRQAPSVKVGNNVTVVANMRSENFESKSLGRKFEHIVFGALEGTDSTVPPAASSGDVEKTMFAQHRSAASGPAEAAVIDVPKADAPDAKRIAEIWSGRLALSDKNVTVRGKVVKFLPNIMGKNWMHLRDGSGSREKGDDDITVTTGDTAAVGDVVIVSGVVRSDKDFGAGYRYPVMLEEARISK